MKTQSKSLKDYLDHLQTDDIVTATQAARRRSMRILEDQGIATIAILISNVIAEAIDYPDLFTERALHAADLR
jgi:TPP-dependent trihydroxycyclohexane-1,2-dione (THcHDO) dehydratase